jgi:hypothetical protein
VAAALRCQGTGALLDSFLPWQSRQCVLFAPEVALSGRFLETIAVLLAFYSVKTFRIIIFSPTGHLLEGISTL